MTVKLPVMLVHGFHGTAANWTATGFRDALVRRGLDPALIHIFDYGYRETGDGRLYNNEGDIREIASRMSLRDTTVQEELDSQVDRLSRKSVAAGGPPGVTLIGHSMGGLVSRYYLSRTRPDEFGTHYRGNVARVIEIATPNLGVDLTRVITLVPPNSIIWHVLRWLERITLGRKDALPLLVAVERQVQQLQLAEHQAEIGPRGYVDSPAVRQMDPGSDFLRALNRPHNTPRDVEFHTIYGDIRLGVSVLWGPVPLWSRSVSFGDLLVPAHSAREVPGTAAIQHAYRWSYEWTIRLDRELVAAGDFFQEHLPAISHSNLLRNPEVQQAVCEILIGTA